MFSTDAQISPSMRNKFRQDHLNIAVDFHHLRIQQACCWLQKGEHLVNWFDLFISSSKDTKSILETGERVAYLLFVCTSVGF